MGGVDWTSREFYTYDTTTGELLDLKDIAIDVNNLKSFLHDKIKEYVNNNFTVVQTTDLYVTIEEIISKNENYGLIEDKFVAILPKYSIGSGADGVKLIEINKYDINPYLVEEYQIP